MAKATQKTNEIKENKIPAKADSPVKFTDSPIEIPLDSIEPSNFPPQISRRARFKTEEIEELGNSIVRQGLISPIIVRPTKVLSGSKAEYEIVSGERRWSAAKLKKLGSINAFVRDLNDETAIEIQMQENLQRVDVDPVDEAISYQFYLDKTKNTIKDLTLRFGKSEIYIKGRLKLNWLIPEAFQDIADGFLPLGHAMEIAKLDPDIQKQALDLCYDTKFNNGQWIPDKEEVETLKDFLEKMEEEIFLSLEDAAFPIDAENLREDGLTCPKCPERTGASESLFEHLHEKDNDRCLNAACYERKTGNFIQITREQKTAEIVAEGKKDEGWKMPIIAWQSHNRPRVEQVFGETPLVDGEYSTATKKCASTEQGIFVDKTYKFGEIINICRNQECKTHRSSISGSSSSQASGEKTLEEKRAFYKRKQELFDVKVGEAVRHEVLKEAAGSFDEKNWVFDDEKWRVKLLLRLWLKIDDNARKFISEIFERENRISSYFSTTEDGIKYFQENFSPAEQSRIFFLAIVANENEMLWGNWRSQKEILELAEEFSVNYALIDAKARARLAPKKYKDDATLYLNKIESGKNASKPVFYKIESKSIGEKVEDGENDKEIELDEIDDEDFDDDDVDENHIGETTQG